MQARGREPLVRRELFGNRQMTGGLLMFFLLYLVQAGLFFTIPLFLSVSLGLSALDTGATDPAAVGDAARRGRRHPAVLPRASPRRVVRFGLLAMFLGVVVLLAAMDATADARIVTVPLLLAGLGIGALASQLGAVTVSAVPDEDSPAVGGLQNTATNLGAALGTALAGSILIASLSAAFLQGVQGNPAIPQQLQIQATVQLASGVPFVSDAQLQTALTEAGVPPDATAAAVDINKEARVAGLRSALSVLAVIAMIGLFAARRIPSRPVQGSPGPDQATGAAAG